MIERKNLMNTFLLNRTIKLLPSLNVILCVPCAKITIFSC